mgnify:CR=1 FL=1
MEQIWTVAALWIGMALLASLARPVAHVFRHPNMESCRDAQIHFVIQF